MTQIEDIAKLVFRPGMTEQDFFQQIYAELLAINYALEHNISIEESKKRTCKMPGAEKTPGIDFVICPYEQEWKKGEVHIYNPWTKKVRVTRPDIDLPLILQLSYNYRRGIHFPDASDKEKEQMQKVMDAPSLMDLSEQGNGPDYFIWQKPKNRWTRNFQDHDFGRFVVNADMNPKLIQELDNFCQKYKCKYKTANPTNWYRRTDTVNVYLYEPMTDKMKKEFVKVMKPYVRKSLPEHTNTIDGEFLADGITCAQEFSEPQRLALIESIPEHIKKQQWNNLMSYYHEEIVEKDENGNEKPALDEKGDIKTYIAMSLGQRKVLEEFLDMYKKYAPKLKANIRVPVQNVTDVKIPTKPTSQQALAPQVPTKPAPQRTPTPPKQSATKSPVDKLKPIRFKIGKTGVSGCKYLDAKGNVIITETYHPNCVKRVYANGLTMQMWYNPPSTTYTDGSKTGKAATEIMVTEMGRGCTKDVTISGALKRKIEEVRKAGLLVTTLPDTPKSPTIKGRLMHHSVKSAQTALKRTKGKVSAA